VIGGQQGSKDGVVQSELLSVKIGEGKEQDGVASVLYIEMNRGSRIQSLQLLIEVYPRIKTMHFERVFVR
jgi:hypothetical protein